MKTMNHKESVCFLIASLVLSGCVTITTPELEATTPQNLFQRSSIEIKAHTFSQVANAKDFVACVKHLEVMCERRDFDAGAPFDAVQFSISIKDRNSSASISMRDYSMYLAGALASNLGYDYFTTINVSDIGRCSSTPSAYSSGRVDSTGNYFGTTTISNSASCSNLYTVTYLAFKKYDPLKRGILVHSKDRRPTLHFDLYFGVADLVETAKSPDPILRQYYQHHPIDAWKYYFPSIKTVNATAAKYGLVSSPNIAAVVETKREATIPRDLRKDLIIRGN